MLALSACCFPAFSKEIPAPFTLTAEQQKDVDRLLDRWEQWNAGITTFRCSFKRWTYNVVFAGPDKPQYVEAGQINYAAPGRILFSVDTGVKDDKPAPVPESRAECWAFDGATIYQYLRSKKRIEEHQLPPGPPEQKLVDGPLSFGFPNAAIRSLLYSPIPSTPFPLGAKAESLRNRYHFRVVTPADRPDQVWLEAYPRHQDAWESSRTTLIVASKDMSPVGLEIVQPNGKDVVRYRFDDVVVNATICSDWFGPTATVEHRWYKIAEKTLRPSDDTDRSLGGKQ